MIKKVEKTEAKDFLEKAEEFIEESKQAMQASRFNASAFNAIQSVINANDALTIFMLGKRASKDHREAIKMHVDVVKIINDSSCRTILKDALDMRSEVGYSGKMIGKKTAEGLVKKAVKFIEWVKEYVKH